MKLSILIPVYQENCIKLVSDLVNQTKRLSIDSEILVFDDCSPIKCEDNRTLSDFERVTYRELEQNIGRSKIRNLLADTASGDVLIFLDGDSGIVREDFIQKYIDTIRTADVVRGGTTYCDKTQVKAGCELHWKYGSKVETNSSAKDPYRFTTNNFCIRKSVFSSLRFNEQMKGYGHEDTLFGIELKERGFSLINIDNPVEHLGLKTFACFMQSTANAIKNLLKLSSEKQYADFIGQLKLVKAYNKLHTYKMDKIYAAFFRISKPAMLNLLAKHNPSLFVLDLYKLGLYCNCHKL